MLSDEAERYTPSLVMNEMNSLTHSCMHSLASFAIFAFSGNAVFMMRATGAKFRILASVRWGRGLTLRCSGSGACGDSRDMTSTFH